MSQKKLFNKKINRESLNSLVDKAADLIRTAVDYKFILVLLFLKRLNDVRKREREQIKERLIKESGLSPEDAQEEAEKFDDFYTFKIPKQYLWDEIGGDIKNLPENLATSISEIAKQNRELQGVIDRVDFLEFARNQENRELLRQLIELFNKYDLGGLDVPPDIFGDAYEHIIMKFAPQKAKEGEIYTPREVINLMIEILDPKPGDKVYDPCCGSGGMLIGSYKHVEDKYGKDKAKKLFLYGQERNPELYAIGQMNLILHGIKSGNLASGDTLDYPRFRQNGRLHQFDMVIANPPWNQDGYGEERLKRADFRERFSFGYPPNNKGDWAWIQHMLASSSKGRVAVVLDQGALFRGAKEKTIRKKAIEEDWIECVILLAEKLFYNTGASGIIVIFNKNKLKERKDKILFINGLEKFDKHPDVRRLNTLTDNNIKEIAKVFETFNEEKNFSKVVNRDKIRENNYNLNVPLYSPIIKEEEKIDIKKVYIELEKLRKEREEKGKKIRKDLENIMKVI